MLVIDRETSSMRQHGSHDAKERLCIIGNGLYRRSGEILFLLAVALDDPCE